MAKIRIYELAKEINRDSKEIIDFLGSDLKPASGIEEAEAAKIRAHFAPKKEAEKKAEPVKAEVPVKEAPKAETKAQEAPKAETKVQEAPKTPENVKEDEAPKKKKPVFLFRPENSAQYKNQNPQRSNNNGQRPGSVQGRNGDRQGSYSGQNERRNSFPGKGGYQNPNERRVIKPNVPTTAQDYKSNMRDDRASFNDHASEKKHETEIQVNTAPEEKILTAAPETATHVQETQVKEAPVVSNVEEKAPAAEVTAKELSAKETSAKEISTKEEKQTTAETAEKAPEKTEEKKLSPADQKREETKRLLEKNTQGQVRNVYREMQEMNERRARENQERRAQEQSQNGERRQGGYQGQNGERRQGGYQGQNGERRGGYQGQNGERRGGYQGQNGERRQGGYQGQNGERRPGGYQGQGGRPQGQGGRPGAPMGQRDNRGIFGKGGNGGNTVVHKEDGQASGLNKADVRGKKNNVKNDKDRQDRDKTGKKAENMKSFTKANDHVKKVMDKKEEETIKMIVLPEVITVKDLSDKMKMKPADIIKKMFLQGKMLTLNSELSYEEAEAIALEYEILCEQEVQVDVIEELLKEDEEDEKLMKKRPPVVCVMGHVDHGKTSLLDAIRDTNVTAREAGGITQHIGAYMVECNGEKITFLDTPGHEAFTAMRMRGAQATDIAILVVAADDGVMPQTVEAINHAKAAGVDIIVAVNKIDKPEANVERVKQELMNYGLVSEEWGGETIFVPVSAKKRENIDQLLEMVLLVTEVKELKANPNREMRGIVIEAKLDKGRGPVATVLVQKGTLKVGDFVSAGSFYGRVRAMLDADGANMKAATPSTPVEILGLNGVPNAGEVCVGHKNEKDARGYAETFIAEEKKKMLAETKQKLTMDSLFAEIQAGNIKELPIIVKADVQGSVEAVRQSLEKLSNEEVSVKVIHGGVGAINESDVSLASASNAIIIGFDVKPDTQAKQLAEQEHVDLRLYKVIYQAIEDVEAAMKGMLAPVYEEQVIAHVEVRMTFKASGVGTIAGSYVLDGTVERGCQVRVTREGAQIFEGNLASLKRFKDDVKEVREGFECGIVLEKFNDLQEFDQIECYKMVQVERK